MIGNIIKGSVPGTGELAIFFPHRIKSLKSMMYAIEVPLMICTRNPTVGGNEALIA